MATVFRSTRGLAAIGAAAVVLGFAVPATGAEVEGVKLPDTVRLTAEGPELRLNGAGLRQRAVFRVYVAGLYLAEKKTTPKEAIAVKGGKRISMTLLRDLAAQQLVDALNEGLRDNHTAVELEAIKARAEELSGLMGSIGAAKSGTVITLDFVPGSGTRVTLNGTARGKPIEGEDFYQALLRIWLGEDPVDKGLKRALLGGG